MVCCYTFPTDTAADSLLVVHARNLLYIAMTIHNRRGDNRACVSARRMRRVWARAIVDELHFCSVLS